MPELVCQADLQFGVDLVASADRLTNESIQVIIEEFFVIRNLSDYDKCLSLEYYGKEQFSHL